MYNDYRLTFADETAWLAVAEQQGWLHHVYEPAEDPEADPVIVSTWIGADNMDIVVLATIYEPQPPTPPDQEPPPPVPYPGYGVNVRYHLGMIAEDLVEYVVFPANPYNSFAGGWSPGAMPVPPESTE